MKRHLLALAIPAALVLAGCSSSEPEYTASGDETTTPVTTSLDAARALNLDMTPTTSDVVRARIVEPPSEAAATNAPHAASDDVCLQAKQAMSAYGLTSADELLAFLQADAADFSASEGVTVEAAPGSTPWSDLSSAEQAEIERQVRAAAAGEC